MAYLGTTIEQIPNWESKWVDGVFGGGYVKEYQYGTKPRTGHLYRCDHCGRETAPQIIKADEPFYCDCGRLIGLDEGMAKPSTPATQGVFPDHCRQPACNVADSFRQFT